MNQRPTLRQLLLCEKLIFEQGTGNVSLINCFTEFPERVHSAKAVSFVVYGVLTDGYGTYTMQLEIERLETEEVIFQKFEPGMLTDRLKQSHVIQRIADLKLPAPGRYGVNLLIDGEPSGMCSFTAKGGG